jgi:hypothetical protein
MKTPSCQCRLVAVAALAGLLAGCGAMNYPGPTAMNGPIPAQGPLIPDATLNLSQFQVQIPLEKVVTWGLYAGAAWLILDPLAPNWEIEQADFSRSALPPFPENETGVCRRRRRSTPGVPSTCQGSDAAERLRRLLGGRIQRGAGIFGAGLAAHRAWRDSPDAPPA